jgi:hypothetical protein
MIGLVSTSVALHGQEIEWKVFEKKGDSFYQVIKTVTDQELEVSDQTFKQKQEQTFLMEWTPKGEKDGQYVIDQKIAGVKMILDIGGNKIEYDSTKDNVKNPMTQFFEALKKAEFTIYVDAKTKKVEKVEGLKDLVGNLTKVNKSFEPVLKQILSEDTIKTLAEPVFGMMPKDGKLPEKDKTWSTENTLKMGPLGTYTTKNTYTYKGTPKGKDNQYEIGVEPKLTYKAPEETKDASLPFTIKSGNLDTKSASGTIYFDKKAGRVDNSNLKVELEGKLTVVISNTSTEVKMKQSQTVDVTTHDKNPWSEKKASSK